MESNIGIQTLGDRDRRDTRTDSDSHRITGNHLIISVMAGMVIVLGIVFLATLAICVANDKWPD